MTDPPPPPALIEIEQADPDEVEAERRSHDTPTFEGSAGCCIVERSGSVKP